MPRPLARKRSPDVPSAALITPPFVTRAHARDRHGLQPRYHGDDHSLVKRHFLQRRAHGVAHKLEKLRSLRNECDYADVVKVLPGMLSDALAEAQMVIAILK